MARTPAKTKPAKNKPNENRNYGDILYEVKDQVAWITINRPRVMNAFREQTLDEMIDAVKSTREDPRSPASSSPARATSHSPPAAISSP